MSFLRVCVPRAGRLRVDCDCGLCAADDGAADDRAEEDWEDDGEASNCGRAFTGDPMREGRVFLRIPFWVRLLSKF